MDVISTGSRVLDEVLDGGVKTGMLTDIFGASSSGKTQLCFHLCVNCLKPKYTKNVNIKVLFIDTTNTFRPERIASIAVNHGMDNTILDHIYLHKVYSSIEQMEAIKRIPAIRDLKLIIIDNISSLFSFEYKQSLSAEKHMKFMRMMHDLALYAINCNIAIVVTNNVRFTDGTQREYLEDSISLFTHVKMELSKTNDTFQARLLKPTLTPHTRIFKITEKGVKDV